MGSFSEWRIKEFFSKEILPYLGSNNYGYDETTINSMKMLGKLLIAKPYLTNSENVIIVNDEVQPPRSISQQTQERNFLKAFEDPDDPLQILNNVPLPNTIPSTSEMRQEISALYENGHDFMFATGSGNRVRVRDEFGSSLMSDRHVMNTEEYVTQFRMDNFPMYDPVTGEIDYGSARRT
jgi:hypothetical protein